MSASAHPAASCCAKSLRSSFSSREREAGFVWKQLAATTISSSRPRSPSLRLIYGKPISVEISLLIDTETPFRKTARLTIRVRDGCSRRCAHEAVASIGRSLRDGLGIRGARSCAPRATSVPLKPIGRRSLSQGRVPVFPGSCLRSGGGGCHCHGQQTHHSHG